MPPTNREFALAKLKEVGSRGLTFQELSSSTGMKPQAARRILLTLRSSGVVKGYGKRNGSTVHLISNTESPVKATEICTELLKTGEPGIVNLPVKPVMAPISDTQVKPGEGLVNRILVRRLGLIMLKYPENQALKELLLDSAEELASFSWGDEEQALHNILGYLHALTEDILSPTG